MPGPARIVSLLSSATELLYALGLGDRVVGVGHECDYPPEVSRLPRLTRTNIDASQTSRAIDDQVRSLLTAGRPLYEVDVERLAALRPELIVTQAQCDVCAVRHDDVLAAVAARPELASARVVALNPRRLDDVLDDLGRLGTAAGAEKAAEQAVAGLRQRIDAVARATADVTDAARPRIACLEWLDPLMLAANWMPDLIALAGGRQSFTVAGEHSGYAPWDRVRAEDPDVILVMPCGFDLERTVAEARSLVERPGWRELRAVRAGRVFAVDGNTYFNRPGPRLVDSLELLAELLHPESAATCGASDVATGRWRRLDGIAS